MENKGSGCLIHAAAIMICLVLYLVSKSSDWQLEIDVTERVIDSDNVLEYDEQSPFVQVMSRYVVDEYDSVNGYMKENFNTELELTDTQAIEVLRMLYLEKYDFLVKEGLAENVPATFDLYLENIGYEDVAQWYIETSELLSESVSTDDELKLALENRN